MSASQKTNDADCPQSSVLLDYVQGRLNPPVLDECEAHVADCDQCHETLRTLNSSDTLTEKVAEVILSNANHGSSEQEDSAQRSGESQHRIGRLIERLTSREFVLANGNANLSRHGMTPAESELLADRAAEVLRYVKEDSSDTEGALGTLGDYRLLHLIGAGSTGVVFQAQDISLNRLVALKVLRPSLGELARQRFLAEARSAASIEHANVVTIYQVGQVDRLAFMAMQWQPGQTLESKLRSGEQFHNDGTSQIIKQIAAGLEAAHQKQVVHRDIKPANIWLCENNDEVKILDFGLARIADDDPGLTATGMLAGTPNFMSPEQSRGLELDGRSDLFSLGCVMYQLLTSRLPFGAPTVLATLQSIQNDSPLVPQSIEPGITDELSDLTMGLLEKQPANRPQTATQLINMLEADRASWPAHVNRYEASRAPVESSAGIAGKSQPANTGTTSWSSRLWQATALILIGTAAWWWSPQIIRVATDQGEVVIETNDDAVEIQVFENGKLIRVVDTDTQQAFDLRSGNYTIKATGDNSAEGTFEVTPNSLVMKRGEQQIVRVTQQPNIGSKTDQPEKAPSELAYGVAIEKYKLANDEYEAAAELGRKGGTSFQEVRRAEYSMNIARLELDELERQREKPTATVGPEQSRGGSNDTAADNESQLPQNGWPQNNTKIDTKELLQRGASTTAELRHRKLTSWPLPISPEWEKTLKAEGYIYAPVGPQDRFDEIIMFRGNSQFSDRSEKGSTVTARQWSIYKNTAIIDVDDYSLQEIEKRSLTLRNLGRENLTGVALRYVSKNGDKIDFQSIPIIPANDPRLDQPTQRSDTFLKLNSSHGRAVANASSSIDGAPTEPVYQGKTFSHWLTTATHDRDDQTRINSIKACRATAETDQQWDSLLLIFNQIVRERGTRLVGGDEIDDGYLAEIGYALQQLPANKAFNFICNEINHGNRKSREFCSVWVQGLWLHFGSDDVSHEDTLQHLQKVEGAVPTLLGPITEHLQEPGVIEVLNAVLQPFDWLTDPSEQAKTIHETHQAIVDEVISQRIPAALKQQALSNTVDFRIAALPAIKELLASDAEVFAKFENDFLNTGTSPKHRRLILIEIAPAFGFSQPPHPSPTLLLEEKCRTVVRLLKSDLAHLPVAIPNPSPHDPQGLLTEKMTREWLVLILTGLEAKLKGQGGAELKTEIAAVLAEAQSQPSGTPPTKTDVASPARSQTGKPKVKQLKYDGKTFEQWYDIAAYDHLDTTYSKALRGCIEIATKEDLAKLMKLFRQIARDRITITKVDSSSQADSVLTMKNILNEAPAQEAVDFVVEEIAAGTKSSRQLCAFWIGHSKHKKELLNRAEGLFVTMVACLDHPGVEDCMESLVGLMDPDKISRPKKQEMSNTQKQFHEAIVGGTPEFRMRYCRSAIKLEGYHQDVFAIYASALLNSETDPVTRGDIFSAMAANGAGSVDDRVKLFLKIANDTLAGDKSQLQFHDQSSNRAWRATFRIYPALLSIYQAAEDISKETKKQFLIPQLESMVAELRAQSKKPDTPRRPEDMSGRTMRKIIPEFEFLIDHLKGNANVEMRSDSIFKLKLTDIF